MGGGVGSGHGSLNPERLGRYQLLRKIAVGGMAEIYLARVSGLGGFQKDVVVKRILPQLAESDEFFAMFLDEARIAATLQHPNVVHIYDAQQAGSEFFIAMEYLDGADLHTVQRVLARRGDRLSLQHAVFVIGSVAAGLHYAHERVGPDGKPLDIVHRDVTPHNVFLTREGGVKLVDFGIAKAANRMANTVFGTLKGKLAYMSPEQCRGEPVDRRSDIYSLGVLLYELTVGRRPYTGKSEYELLREIAEGEASPPGRWVADYPADLEAIAMRMLAREREGRYSNMLEVEQDLERFARRHSLVGSTLALAEFIAPVVDAAQRQAEARHRRRLSGAPPLTQGADAEVDKAQGGEHRGEGRADGQDTVAAIPWPRQRRLGSSGPGASPVASGTRRGEATPLPERVSTVEPPVKAEAEAVDATVAEPTPVPATRVPRVRPRRLPFILLLLITMAAGGAAAALLREGVRRHERSDPAPKNERGALWVTSQPPGAAVWISLGPAPAVSGPLDRGREHKVRVEQFGYRPRDVAIPAAPGSGPARAEIAVELEPAGERDAAPPEPAALPGQDAPRAEGQIRILSQPPAARVWLLVGVTPARIDHVSTAVRHELRVARSDTLPAFLTVEPEEFGPGGEARAWAMLPARDPQPR